MRDEIKSAISHVPADDRETWVLVGMAVKSALADDGFDLWDIWSQTSDRYSKAAARSVWKSIKPHGGVTVLTLYKLARQHGWTGSGERAPVPARKPAGMSEQEKLDAKARRDAALEAAHIVKECRTDNHPYLDKKGFPEEVGLIDFDGRLVIPMRNATNYGQIQSCQFIDGDGNKRFLPNGAAKSAAFFIGTGRENWLCEGYATGLSIRAALKTMYRSARVVVCFSAANIRAVGADLTGPIYIVADHDKNRVGERYASETGAPYVMPPDVGDDANDYHQAHGVFALAKLLRGAIA